ncbi:hypothetical protein, partial [Escherichia coli]|uniref:hypothetical protein n=1 Tax=Escherichia coli TaxID=562 RepID=UPI000A6273F1
MRAVESNFAHGARRTRGRARCEAELGALRERDADACVGAVHVGRAVGGALGAEDHAARALELVAERRVRTL